MPCNIESHQYGVVKRFSGVVIYEDVLRSEQRVHEDPDFTRMRYVISDYSDAEYSGLTDSQKADIYALRIGGHYSNPRINYALVIKNPVIREQIGSAVADGEMLHQAQTFDTLEQASDWAGL